MKSVFLLFALLVALAIGLPVADRDVGGFEPADIRTENGGFYLSYGDWKSSQPEDSDISFEQYQVWLGRQKKPRDAVKGLVEDDVSIIVKRGNVCCVNRCLFPYSKDCRTVCYAC